MDAFVLRKRISPEPSTDIVSLSKKRKECSDKTESLAKKRKECSDKTETINDSAEGNSKENGKLTNPALTQFYHTCCKLFKHMNLGGLSYEWFVHIFGCKEERDVIEMFERVDSALGSVAPKDVICPKVNQIWRWSTLLRPKDVKVIILGQDPYHTVIRDSNGKYVHMADGLAFSMNAEYRAHCSNLPPSLRNIAKLAAPDVYSCGDFHGDLSGWCRNGVLLLNCTLTTVKGIPNAHSKIGWNHITDLIISSFGNGDESDMKVFLLWGAEAREKAQLINNKAHTVLTSCHPSPFSAEKYGWFDNNHFQTANLYLRVVGKKPINWALEYGEPRPR